MNLKYAKDEKKNKKRKQLLNLWSERIMVGLINGQCSRGYNESYNQVLKAYVTSYSR